MVENTTPDYGVLVGWTSQRVGDRLRLRLQMVDKPPPYERGDVRDFYLMLDANQAAQLGTNLFEMTEQTKPPRPQGPLARLLRG